MPEQPEGTDLMIRMDKDKKDHFNKYQVPMKGLFSLDGFGSISNSLAGHMRFYPQTYCVGTATKKYSTIQGINSQGFSGVSEPPVEIEPHAKRRLGEKIYKKSKYLMYSSVDGEFVFSQRGKTFALAAGHVSSSSQSTTCHLHAFIALRHRPSWPGGNICQVNAR